MQKSKQIFEDEIRSSKTVVVRYQSAGHGSRRTGYWKPYGSSTTRTLINMSAGNNAVTPSLEIKAKSPQLIFRTSMHPDLICAFFFRALLAFLLNLDTSRTVSPCGMRSL